MLRLLLATTFSVILSGCAPLPVVGVETAVRSPVAQPDRADPAPTTQPANPTNPVFIEERARQADATGRRDVAEGYYLQLTRLKPNDAAPWFRLGNLYAEQGRLDSAERAYREALRRRDDAKTLHNLGLVQVKLGVGALREAQTRLPSTDAARQETRELLQTLLETALP
ncbi:MAG: tetratricopeptide repeat protein [Candidatus Contendobacter sp.]|nr:tetratricopeptide repeat protein [Candidatus Contendobacter sp.]